MNLPDKFHDLRVFARKDGAGVGASFLLHLLVFLALILLARRALPPQPPFERFIPVSLIAQSEGPAPTPAQQKAAGELSKEPTHLPRAPVAHHTPTAVAPDGTKEPEDDLSVQLKALSKLRQPNTDTRLLGNQGVSTDDQTGDDDYSGGQGLYNTRDLIRAQVLRRWSLDMSRLGNRNFDILIRVYVKRDGTVLEADIVDAQRAKTDSTFRWIATSAKNAVLLSSPLTLPPDFDRAKLELTLRLNPREAMR